MKRLVCGVKVTDGEALLVERLAGRAGMKPSRWLQSLVEAPLREELRLEQMGQERPGQLSLERLGAMNPYDETGALAAWRGDEDEEVKT